MKENEFLDGVSNIDADVIERFVNMDNKLQSKSKRSKGVFLRVLALAASIALVIGVIAVVMLHNGETGQDIPAKPSLNERVFLNVATKGETANNGFDDSATHGVYTQKNTEQFDNLVNTKKQLPFGNNKEFVYKQSDCAYKTSESQEYGDFYSIYDVYSNGEEKIMYLRGTDLLCFYTSSEALEGMTVAAKSKEEAKNIADNFSGFVDMDIKYCSLDCRNFIFRKKSHS